MLIEKPSRCLYIKCSKATAKTIYAPYSTPPDFYHRIDMITNLLHPFSYADPPFISTVIDKMKDTLSSSEFAFLTPNKADLTAQTFLSSETLVFPGKPAFSTRPQQNSREPLIIILPYNKTTQKWTLLYFSSTYGRHTEGYLIQSFSHVFPNTTPPFNVVKCEIPPNAECDWGFRMLLHIFISVKLKDNMESLHGAIEKFSTELDFTDKVKKWATNYYHGITDTPQWLHQIIYPLRPFSLLIR